MLRADIFARKRHSLYPYKSLRSGYCSFRTSYDVDRKRIRLGFTILLAKTTEIQNSIVLEHVKHQYKVQSLSSESTLRTYVYSHLTNQSISIDFFQNKLRRLRWLYFKYINSFYLILHFNKLFDTDKYINHQKCLLCQILLYQIAFHNMQVLYKICSTCFQWYVIIKMSHTIPYNKMS